MDFTILTPTLNAARWLPRCIASVRLQDPSLRVEHLVLDGASRDGTAELARAAGCTVSVARDGSLYEALNRGLRLASGEVIGWLNADDVLAPGALRAVAAALERAPSAELALGDWEVSAHGRVRRVRAPRSPLAAVRKGVTRLVWVTPLAAYFRRETLLDLGGYRAEYRIAADLDVWLRAAARPRPIRTIDAGEVLGTFTVHPESLSSGDDPAPSLRETLEITRRWSEDPAAPPGVRRHALFLYRHNRFVRCRWETRQAPMARRIGEMWACWREVAPLGPGTWRDARGQVNTLLLELAAAAVGRDRPWAE